ncbi:MAG: prolipoprotein diacylglyceryl transferase [Spirochaetaceae bacterium]
MLAYFQFPDWLSTVIIPGLPFRWYGLMYLVAFAVTYVLFRYEVKRRKLDVDPDTVLNMFFWAILGLLIGARLFATLLFDPTGYYLSRPWLIFWPFDANMNFVGLQGMNYYGGLAGGIVAVLIYARVGNRKGQGIDILQWGDILTAAIPLGYTFGRLGNFINGELFGRVTSVAWGVIFPNARRFPVDEPWVQEMAADAGMDLTGVEGMVNLPRHPTQLYEAATEGIILWLVMWFIFRKRNQPKGTNVGIYLIGYGFFRFVIDYFRVPLRGDFSLQLSGIANPPYLLLTPWNFIASQFYSLIMIAAGVIVIVWMKKRADRPAAAPPQEKKKPSSRRMRRKLQKK